MACNGSERDYLVQIDRVEVVEVVVRASNAKEAAAIARHGEITGEGSPIGHGWWGPVRRVRRAAALPGEQA